ncbi:MAG TPA: ATP-binding protein [Planctomycetota bacterium]|nr:ATP-binding protein [Planctomycetota bacterium]
MERARGFWRSPLFRSLFPAILVVACLPVLATAIGSLSLGRRAAAEEASRRLRSEALLARASGRALMAAHDVAGVDALAKKLGHDTGTRFTFIDGAGVVLGDSEHDPHTMDNHAKRPEVVDAIEVGFGQSARRSDTLSQDMFYVAVPADDASRGNGVVRAALPSSVLEAQFRASLEGLTLIAAPFGVVALVALGLTLLVVVRDLDDVTRVARLVAAGGRFEPLRASDRRDEIGDLAVTVQRMAQELEGRVLTIEHERNELAAIVSGMDEGLLAIDARGKLLLSNEAAARALGSQVPFEAGKDLVHVVSHGDVLALVRTAREEGRAVSKTIEVFPPSRAKREVEVRVTPLADAQGAVVLLRDITEAVQYERLRREFVANVSHELRTPLTLVKGFLENLEDGALLDPEKGPRFVKIAQRHVEALEALVEDLLTLGRLDAGAETRPLAPVSLRDTIDLVAAGFEELLARKKLALVTKLPDDMPLVMGHRDLIERALRNLVDNAIKYSDQGTITVSAWREESFVIVEVADTGIGIPRADLPRIFERFYRVEKSRTREAGGTGLGLAIVKHIAQQEGGMITVESEPGRGSKFRLSLKVAG